MRTLQNTTLQIYFGKVGAFEFSRISRRHQVGKNKVLKYFIPCIRFFLHVQFCVGQRSQFSSPMITRKSGGATAFGNIFETQKFVFVRGIPPHKTVLHPVQCTLNTSMFSDPLFILSNDARAVGLMVLRTHDDWPITAMYFITNFEGRQP